VRPFSYTAPGTLAKAISTLGRSARPLAGGTDLITLMKADLYAPERLVAVRSLLPSGITSAEEGVTVGAATVLSDIAANDIIARRFAAVAQAAEAAASLQLSNMATLGGNLLQRPRCWYFRNPHIPCWLKGGDNCPARDGENRQHALFGGDRCVAVHPSDLAPALLAFDAELHVRSAQGERKLRLGEFFALPEDGRRSETMLGEGELVLAVRLPPHSGESRSIYLKAMDRAAFSFALAGVAAVVRLSEDGRRIAHVRVVLSGVAPIPWRAHAAEAVLLGAQISERLLQNAATAAVSGAVPLRLNRWKITLLKALVERALRELVK
jgi:xanthine dehydrogenase YagS FAD-binding subunit